MMMMMPTQDFCHEKKETSNKKLSQCMFKHSSSSMSCRQSRDYELKNAALVFFKYFKTVALPWMKSVATTELATLGPLKMPFF